MLERSRSLDPEPRDERELDSMSLDRPSDDRSTWFLAAS